MLAAGHDRVGQEFGQAVVDRGPIPMGDHILGGSQAAVIAGDGEIQNGDQHREPDRDV